MRDLYHYAKKVDHLSVDLPLDFMGFCRFFCIEDMVQKAGGQDSLQNVGYAVVYEVLVLFRCLNTWV